jgi:ribose transport system substrate-binding protein
MEEMEMSRTKLVLIALALAFCATTLGACGSGDGGESNSYDLVMISAPPGDDFYYTIEQSAQAEAEKLGVNLDIQNFREYTAAGESPVLNAAAARQPDAILFTAQDATALVAPVERVADQGIKVILYDGGLDDQSAVETFVSADIVELGRSAARAQLDLIGGEGGPVFYQHSLANTSFFDQIREGWTEILDQQPRLEQLPPVYSDFEVAKANSQMQAILAAHPDVIGGFVGTLGEPEAMISAIERADKLDRVRTVGVDASPEHVALLREGSLGALVSVDASAYGTAIVRAAVDSLNGKELPETTVIGQCILTKDNLDDPANKGCIYEDSNG